MTPRVFYSNTALPQNKAKLEQIGKKYYKEIKQAEALTKVPGALISWQLAIGIAEIFVIKNKKNSKDNKNLLILLLI